MSDSTNPTALFGEALLGAIRQAVRQEIQSASLKGHATELFTPEQLADKLKVPLSWVYEQSRQGNLPTHRFGKYIRFDLHEVLRNHKKD